MAGAEWPFTMLGRKFFDADLPRLVTALERIGKALEKQEKKEETLSERERATILAALRYWQANLEDGLHCDGYAFRDIANDEGALVEMNEDEIDALCIKLNTED